MVTPTPEELDQVITQTNPDKAAGQTTITTRLIIQAKKKK
jgi:hypothetical protein